MAKRQAQSTPPLTGAVQRVGVRPTVARTQRAAAVADLRVRFTGGKAGSAVRADDDGDPEYQDRRDGHGPTR